MKPWRGHKSELTRLRANPVWKYNKLKTKQHTYRNKSPSNRWQLKMLREFNAEIYFRERRLRCKQTEPRSSLEQILVCKFLSETFCFAFVLLQDRGLLTHHQVKKAYYTHNFAQPLNKYLTQYTARILSHVNSISFLCNNRIEKLCS